MDSSKLENDLISEIKLTPIQAKIFLLVTWYGKMSAIKLQKNYKSHLQLLKKLPLIL